MKNFIILSSVLLTNNTVSVKTKSKIKVLRGRIVDAGNHSGIAFTNIGIEGTVYRTDSNDEGFFELKYPDHLPDQNLFVSAPGYEYQTYSLHDLPENKFARLLLTEQKGSAEDVDVAARSRVLFRIIRTASEKVPKNFHAGPFAAKYSYLGNAFVNDSATQVREAIVEVTDKTGYRAPGMRDAHRNRNHSLTELAKNFSSYSFPEGQSNFDELIEQDIARQGNMIFNELLINDFDLHLESENTYEGEPAWVISYKINNPELAHSGDYYATKMEGRLYILKNNYALVRNECLVQATKNNPQNRSLYTEGDAKQNVTYHFTTSYRKQDGKYLLSFMDQDKTFTSPTGDKVIMLRKASLIDFIKTTPELIPGRNYFESPNNNGKS